MLHAIWQGALIAGVAALVLARMRGNDSTSRYAVAFVALLAVPAVCGLTIWRTLTGNSTPFPFLLDGFLYSLRRGPDVRGWPAWVEPP